MTRPRDWEAVGREALYYVLVNLASEVEASVEPVADTVYWGGDPDAEQVERLRALAFEFEYAVEAYVAALADGAEPWGGDGSMPPRETLGGDASPSRDAGDATDDPDAGSSARDRPDADPSDADERTGRNDASGNSPATDDPPADEDA